MVDMTVDFIIKQARSGELRSLSDKDKTDEVIINYINLGLIELFKRFNLKTSAEVIRTSPTTPFYTLRSEDINQVISVYDTNNKELITKRTTDDEKYDIAQINYNSFLITEPKDEELLFVYKAAPELVSSVNDEIQIPYAMLEALLHYIGYRAHGSVNGEINAEQNTHYMRFDKSCALLLSEGYETDALNVSDSVSKRGFV